MFEVNLKVVPNPYVGGPESLDEDGQPSIGFMRAEDPTSPVGGMVDQERSDLHKTHKFKFSDSVVLIRCFTIDQYGYYKRGIEDGCLLPADEATGKKVFGADYKHVDPAKALAAAKSLALGSDSKPAPQVPQSRPAKAE
jgi:hypothetical protein